MTVISFTEDQLLQTAHIITLDIVTPSIIREFHASAEGAEMLRLIVRDDLAGTADKITNALWAKL